MTLSTWSITLALPWCFQRGHSCSKAIMCKQNCPFDMEVSHLWQVSHVINYDLPHNIDSYVHRIGHQLSWCQGSVNCGLDRSVGSHSREIAVISRVAPSWNGDTHMFEVVLAESGTMAGPPASTCPAWYILQHLTHGVLRGWNLMSLISVVSSPSSRIPSVWKCKGPSLCRQDLKQSNLRVFRTFWN